MPWHEEDYLPLSHFTFLESSFKAVANINATFKDYIDVDSDVITTDNLSDEDILESVQESLRAPAITELKMSMKSQHLQAMFARKREMDHMHKERTQAVSKYYDHWGKVTQRFENWSTPEYYKEADDKLQHTKDLKEKEKTLDVRREKLRRFLDDEKEQFELEIKERQRPNWQKMHRTQTLEKINENLKEQQTIRRKLELEAKLYGKWRHGVDDDNLVFESKSDNEVIAKLNWLDKQVEQQIRREKDEEQAKERDLRLQEERNKAEQLHKERQQIREQEIREIRALQEMHMAQLKERQMESSSFKEQEQKYRANLEDLEKELELLEESYTALQQPADFNGAYNLTKIKVYMRKRAEIFRNQIELCVSILERCLTCVEKSALLNSVKEKLIQQLASEMYQLTQIDAMYESEAKHNLQKCEDLWKQQSRDRYKELKELLNSEHLSQRKLLNDVLRQQSELIDIRSTHFNAIETTAEKLKQLIKEEEESPRPYDVYANQSPSSHHRYGEECKKSVTFSPRKGLHHNYDASTDGIHVTNSFNHLNMDVSEYDGPCKRDSDTVHLGGQRSLQIVTAENVERPLANINMASPPLSHSHRGRDLCNHNYDASTDVDHATNSFNHLNMDDRPCKRDTDTLHLGGQRSLQGGLERPLSHINMASPPLMDSHRGQDLCNHNYDASPDGNHVTNSFNHLNMDVPEYDGPCKRDSDTVHLGGQRSLQVVTADNVERPLSNINMASPPLSHSHRGRGLYNHNYDASTDVNHATNSFNHLNMDVSEYDGPCKRDSDTVHFGGQGSLQIVTAENVERPKFGRKRSAWT